MRGRESPFRVPSNWFAYTCWEHGCLEAGESGKPCFVTITLPMAVCLPPFYFLLLTFYFENVQTHRKVKNGVQCLPVRPSAGFQWLTSCPICFISSCVWSHGEGSSTHFIPKYFSPQLLRMTSSYKTQIPWSHLRKLTLVQESHTQCTFTYFYGHWNIFSCLSSRIQSSCIVVGCFLSFFF